MPTLLDDYHRFYDDVRKQVESMTDEELDRYYIELQHIQFEAAAKLNAIADIDRERKDKKK